MSNPPDPPLIRYLESHLGPIAKGFSVKGEKVQVAQFDNQPVRGATTLMTLGLSNHKLHLVNGDLHREELMISARKESEIEYLGRVLHLIATDVLERHHALVRGEVLGPAGPVIPNSTLEAFFCLHPAYWPESFDLFKGPEFQTHFIWLVPITAREAEYVKTNGWQEVFNKIEAQDPDLLNLRRPSLNL